VVAKSDNPRAGSRRWLRRLPAFGALGILAVAVLFFAWLPGAAERRINSVEAPSSRPLPVEAAALHRRLVVADLHADSLLWNRDLLERGSRGHVDLPRLREGNVALQVFSAVTRAPTGPDYQNGIDRCLPLLLSQRWPPRTWGSLVERALYQAERLHRLAARADGSLVVVRSASDLRAHLARRAAVPGTVAGLLAIEGLQAIERNPANLDRLFEAGYRMMGLVHFYDNAVGGSAHGGRRGGLSELGRRVIRRMEQRGIVVDLAHASEGLIDDVLDMVTKPVVFSHTGVKGTCYKERNISDRHLRRVAQNGGVVGIGYFRRAVCDVDAAAVVRAMRHVADLVGVDHVALGSDWDGAVRVPFDAANLARITEALLDAEFDEEQIARIAAGNVLRVLERTLPP
jgi:microsomal dipeptidase-like Zn-dependent dipeptidase